jgi:hypothetical protein
MSWKTRLRDMLCAGGTLAACTSPHVIPCGNASSDPCICGRDTTQAEITECAERTTCEDHGGTWSDLDNNYADGRTGVVPHCSVADAGVRD